MQNLSFTYDRLGDPLSRGDANTSMSETFGYDALNRLTSTTVNLSPTPLSKSFSYSPIGNLLSKSDVGNYGYPSAGSPLPHAVMSVSGGSISTTFTYDPNGNQTSGLGSTITWSSYNKPASITQGAQTISFLDDTAHQRFKQITPAGTTLYIAAFEVLAELASPGASAATWTDYLSVGNAMVGMRILQSASETLNLRYFHVDHLGSISVITDANGVVLERLSYDAWGKRRFPNGADDPTGSITSETTRGFTGQEELSVSGLIHLNGRVYDPLLARMTSADPTVTDPTNPQGWNRYSYVGNDPLAFTDPNGFSWLSSFFHSISNAITSAVHAISSFLQTNAIARAIVQIAITAILAVPTLGLGPILAAAGGAAISTGLSGGNLGQILKAGAIAGAAAFAFYEVGSTTNAIAGVDPSAAHIQPGFGTDAYAFNVAGHALVGCGVAVANGSSCGSGALSGAVTAGAGPLISGQSYGTALVENAVLGGAASVLGGGKFANGAVTGAFGYMFNNCYSCLQQHDANPMNSGRALDTWSPFDFFNPGAIIGFAARFTAATVPFAMPEMAAVVGTGGALVPMADAAVNTGTIRTIAGYEIGGNAGLVGSTYNMNIWALYATEDAQGLGALANALKAEAGAAGATDISISGNGIINPGIANMNPAIAARYGFSFSQINPTTIFLKGPVP